jgi:hypothetical protein
MAASTCDVRFTPKADIPPRRLDVCFGPRSDICGAARRTLCDHLVGDGGHVGLNPAIEQDDDHLLLHGLFIFSFNLRRWRRRGYLAASNAAATRASAATIDGAVKLPNRSDAIPAKAGPTI